MQHGFAPRQSLETLATVQARHQSGGQVEERRMRGERKSFGDGAGIEESRVILRRE